MICHLLLQVLILASDRRRVTADEGMRVLVTAQAGVERSSGIQPQAPSARPTSSGQLNCLICTHLEVHLAFHPHKSTSSKQTVCIPQKMMYSHVWMMPPSSRYCWCHCPTISRLVPNITHWLSIYFGPRDAFVLSFTFMIPLVVWDSKVKEPKVTWSADLTPNMELTAHPDLLHIPSPSSQLLSWELAKSPKLSNTRRSKNERSIGNLGASQEN